MPRPVPREVTRNCKTSLLVALAVAALSSCASPRIYHAELGARYESYAAAPSEPVDAALSRYLAQPVFTLSGNNTKLDLNGFGGQIALQERVRSIVARLALSFTSYGSVKNVYQVPTIGQIEETLSCKSAGLDGSVGYQIGWFRPLLSYKLQSLVTTMTLVNPGGTRPESNDTYSETQFLVGGGLGVEVPISHVFRFAAQGTYRVPLTSGSVGAGGYHEVTVLGGLLFGGWELR